MTLMTPAIKRCICG